MVESIRYWSVTLDDRSALLFSATLRSRPILAALVNSLHLEMLNLKYTLSELALPSTWNTLINIRSLSLTVCASSQNLQSDGHSINPISFTSAHSAAIN